MDASIRIWSYLSVSPASFPVYFVKKFGDGKGSVGVRRKNDCFGRNAGRRALCDWGLPGEAKQWKIFGTSITFETVVVNFENDIASEKRPWNQNAFIKINDLGVIVLGKEFYTQ